MKKLKCESCGGDLKIDDDKQYAYCEYCNSKYKLNEDLTINIKLDDEFKKTLNDGKKIGLVFFIPIFVFALVMIISTVTFISRISDNFDSNNDFIDQVNDKIDNSVNNSKNEQNIRIFNSKIEMYSGTQSTFFVRHLLDDINLSNKTNDRKISVTYNTIVTYDYDEIVDIKLSLATKDYEVVLNYDDDKYINNVEIR